MAKYLVTGAAGFIGSSLVHALLDRGDEVRGIDNLSTGRRENLAGVIKRMDFRQVDILDLDATRKACEGMDYVLHQAAIPSVPKSVLDPVGSNRANVDGTLNVLVAARDAKVKRVVYAASSSAYGDTPTLPKHEAMNPNPISPYAVAKLTGELYMTSFYRCYGLETVSLRYFKRFLATASKAATSITLTMPSPPTSWPAPLRPQNVPDECSMSLRGATPL